MILYHFSNDWGFDPSPFCLKVQAYLRLADIPFEGRTGFAAFRRAPRKQLPYIEDNGNLIADSAQIIEYAKHKYGDRLDHWLAPEQKSVGHAVSRMLEGGTYWVGVYNRWIENEVWSRYHPVLFGQLPRTIRPVLRWIARRDYNRRLYGIGLARRPAEEIYELGRQDIGSIAGVLGDKPFLLGEKVCSYDATVYGFLANALYAPLGGRAEALVREHPKLVAYIDRMRQMTRLPEP